MWLKYKKQIAIFNVWGPETSIVSHVQGQKKDIKNILNGKSIPVGKSSINGIENLKDKRK